MTANHRGDWPGLAQFSARLLGDRRAAFGDGDPRVRVMAAIAEVWRRVRDREDLPSADEQDALGAYWAEMRSDLETVVERARHRAVAAPSPHTTATAARAEALLYYHRPPEGRATGSPLIVLCHYINQAHRAAAHRKVA